MPGPGSGPAGSHGRPIAKPKNAGRTFARLLGYLKKDSLRVVVIVLGLLVSAGAGVAGTYLLKPIINQLSELVTKHSTDLSVFVR